MTGREPTGRDERIGGWLDGVLDPDETARFEADLARDPGLRAQVAAWQANDDLLREAFSAPIREGVDNALLERMNLARPQPRLVFSREDAPAGAGPANDDPIGWPTGWRRRLRPRVAVALGGLVAAGLALAVILPGQQARRDDPMALAMAQLPSGSARTLPDGSRVTPVLSFAAADGRMCREFALAGRSTGSGIACKGTAGWTIEARSDGSTAPAATGRIGTAGGPDGAGLDAAYARLGAGDPLPASDERALIAAGWPAAPIAKKGRE